MGELTPLSYGRVVRPSIAHNIDKINEIVNWINNSEIVSTKLVETGEGTEIQVGNATQLASLGMEGLAIQDGTPTPDNPQEVRVARGRNLATVNNVTPSTKNTTLVDFGENRSFESIAISFTANALNVTNTSGSLLDLQKLDGTHYYVYILNIFSLGVNNGRKSYVIRNIEFSKVILFARSDTYGTYTAGSFDDIQLEAGSTATPYVPYGHVGLEVRDSSDELVSVTPIPLPSKGFAAALPDGTADKLTIDAAGGVEWESGIALYTITGNETISGSNQYGDYRKIYFSLNTGAGFNASSLKPILCTKCPYAYDPDGQFVHGYVNGDSAILFNVGTSATDVLASYAGAEIFYELVNHTTERTYIDMPEIPDNAKMRILATLEPGFNAGWFTENALPMIVNALNVRIESTGSSNQVGTLGNVRESLEIGNELKPIEKQTEETKEPETEGN